MKPSRRHLTVFSNAYFQGHLLFENWKLEIKENYNSYNEIDNPKGLSQSEVEVSIIRLFDNSIISQVSC